MGRIRNDLLLVLVLLAAAGIGWLALRPAGGGVQAVVTVDGGERLYVSRQYAADLKEKLHELERSFGK